MEGAQQNACRRTWQITKKSNKWKCVLLVNFSSKFTYICFPKLLMVIRIPVVNVSFWLNQSYLILLENNILRPNTTQNKLFKAHVVGGMCTAVAPLTAALFQKTVGYTPPKFNYIHSPIISISWAQIFCKAKNILSRTRVMSVLPFVPQSCWNHSIWDA